jgi:hypothetical protein
MITPEKLDAELRSLELTDEEVSLLRIIEKDIDNDIRKFYIIHDGYVSINVLCLYNGPLKTLKSSIRKNLVKNNILELYSKNGWNIEHRPTDSGPDIWIFSKK